MMFRFAACFGVCLLVATSPAAAAVTYNFTAFSSFPFDANGGNGDENWSGSFLVTTPTAITTDTTIPSGLLTNCTIVGTLSGAIPCTDQSFLFGQAPGTVTVSFSAAGFGIYYYFDLQAFSTNGTWNTIFFGTDQQGRLITSGVTNAVVPEPASWAMLIAGLGLTGAAMRRRRVQVAAARKA